MSNHTIVLESYNDITKEYTCRSMYTGEVIFDGVVEDNDHRLLILDAVRKAEEISVDFMRNKAIRHMENL